MAIDFGSIRKDFPALDKHTYLNTAGIGVTPIPATREMQRVLGEWSEHGATTPVFRQEVQPLAEGARTLAAELFGAKPEELAFTGRVAESFHIAIDGMNWKKGDEIITSDEEVLYMPIYRLAMEEGVIIKKMSFVHDKDKLLNQFSDLLTRRTRFVWFSDTTNKSGIHIPVKEICKLAHEKGSLVMYDGAQTAGQTPVNLHDIGCDFYAITGYKWLLGPYGCGLCYVREDLIPEIKALRVGHGKMDYATNSYVEDPTALRYDFGVRNIVLRIGFGRTLQYLGDIGFENIQKRVTQIRDYLWKGLDDIKGVRIASPRDPSLNSGLSCVDIAGKPPREVVAKAWEDNIVIVPLERSAARPDLNGVRVSPSFYNNEKDIDRFLEFAKKLAAS